jgi:signal transduction histidine kinase
MLRGGRTLRGRVTLLTVLAAAVVVALLIGAFNVVLATALDRAVDRALRSKAAAAMTTVRIDGDRVRVRDAPGDEAIDRQVWVYAGRRAVVRPAGAGRLQAAADALARSGGASADLHRPDSRLRRVGLDAGGRRVGAVVVAESLEPYDRTTDIALAGSVALGGLLLALVATLTWIATGRALHPVREMTRTAAAWSAHDQQRRFGTGPRPDELGELASTFDALLDRLAASLRHEQRLSAELSHELRTPLARIAAEAELLTRHARSADDVDDGLRAITSDTVEMTSILDTLMKAARADAGLERGRAGLDEVFARLAERWRPALAAHGIRLDVADPEGIEAGVDGDVAERIITPLLHNAERHAESRVSLSAERSAGAVLVTVDDDGAGIPVPLRDAFFEPGRRAGEGDGNGNANGAGLGLALARRLARATGGDVDVTDTPDGAGVRLRVRLPA